MKLSVTLLPFLVPFALSETLPPCSRDCQTPCSCPSGSEYHQSSVSGVIGAAAADVKAVTSDFFDTAWQGFELLETSGSDNELTSFTENPDGSYVQIFEQLSSTLPIDYHSGFLAGLWVTFSVSSCSEYETAVVVTFYTCATGDPFGGECNPSSWSLQRSLLASEKRHLWRQGLGHEADHGCLDTGASFEVAWGNVSDILEKQGKLSGRNQPIEEDGEGVVPSGCFNT
ncbi:hypothetical protein Q9189_000801 [Teloschistes chrysophthalmus]